MSLIPLHIERFPAHYASRCAPATLFFVILFAVGLSNTIAQPATLYVAINNRIEGAEVLMNGRLLGRTDSRGIFAIGIPTPGSYTITVRKDGYEPQEKTLTFQPGLSESFEVTLLEASAILLVHTQPGSASVFIDDRYFGQTDPGGELIISLRPGWHTVHVEKEGYGRSEVQRVLAWEFAENVSFALAREHWIWRLLRENGQRLLISLLLVGAMGLIGFLIRQAPAGMAFPEFFRVLNLSAVFGGNRIAGYSLAQARQLGRGGMASVYLAYDPKLKRHVALKVMDSGLLSDADLVRKFLKEGEALQRIASRFPQAPVVRAYRYGRDYRTAERLPYLVLEYLNGFSLLQVLRQQKRLTLLQAFDVAEQVAQGLAAAHANQIWHRDVTPDNIIVTQTEPRFRVKVIDFGVAKHEYTNTRTLDGSITGKPPYMSPEQCRGEVLDGRTDIYALGIMLYTMLSGAPPFTDANPLMVMRMHEVEPVPPLVGDVPESVRTLIYQMLAKRREDRPTTMDEVTLRIRRLRAQLSFQPLTPLP